MWPTLLLVGLSTIFSTVFGMLMGIYGGWRRSGAFDLSSMGVSLVLYAMPEFWLGILLPVFSVALGCSRPGGTDVTRHYTGIAHVVRRLNHLFLPVPHADARLPRRVLPADALLAAGRAGRGVRHHWHGPRASARSAVLRRHAVPNALLPTVTLIALNFGFVLGGAITVEAVFSYPGLGLLDVRRLAVAGLPAAPGPVPVLQPRGDPGEPRRRPALRLPRSPGQGGVDGEATPPPRCPRPRPDEAVPAPEHLTGVANPRRIAWHAAPARRVAVLEEPPQEQDGDGGADHPDLLLPGGRLRAPARATPRASTRRW